MGWRALLKQSWWVGFLSLGETSVYTLHFDLNSRCHGLPPNDTQHHTPDRLDEFFALCPHLK